MRVVLDTNVLVSRFLSPGGTPARIFALLEQEAFELVVSEPILAEYRATLSYSRIQARHGLSPAEIDELVSALRSISRLVEVSETPQVIAADPADDKFLACAVTGRADYIISGDKHLLALEEYQNIQIVTPALFLSLISPST